MLGRLLGIVAALAMLTVAGCPQDSSDGTTDGNTDRSTPGARLYVVNNASGTIASFANPQQANGDVAPTTLLGGPATGIDGPGELIVTDGGLLIVPNFLDDSISVFDSALTRTGNAAPRNTARGIGVPATLAYDAATDQLYVGAPAGPTVPVYAAVSTTGFSGAATPVRTISSTALSSARGLLLFDGALYVADRASESILVFNAASSANGSLVPDRTIRGNPAFSGIQDLVVDAAGRLFVVNSFAGRVDIFADPRALNGAVAPSGSFRISGGKTLAAIAIDSGGVGYIADSAANAIYMVDGVAAQNGLISASRTIKGPSTSLNLPSSVVVR
jgi:DNA-binding beta-propeller fold protein YncE